MGSRTHTPDHVMTVHAINGETAQDCLQLFRFRPCVAAAGLAGVPAAEQRRPGRDRNPACASAAARGGVLWVAMCNGWSCNPERVAAFLALIERLERRA